MAKKETYSFRSRDLLDFLRELYFSRHPEKLGHIVDELGRVLPHDMLTDEWLEENIAVLDTLITMGGRDSVSTITIVRPDLKITNEIDSLAG